MTSLFSGPAEKEQFFLGMILTEQSVQAVLWKIDHGQIVIDKKSEIYQITTEDQAVIQADKALQDLGKNSENLKEVVFALEPSWSDDRGILDTKKPLLKKLSEDLSLEAVGFVVITEAVIQNLTKTDSNLNGVLVFYTATQIDVAVVEGGIIKKTESVGRSEEAISDLVEALARIKADHPTDFPPQIKLISISLDQDELYEQQQTLIDHDWVGEGHFASLPTITMVDPDTVVNSLVDQGGRAIAQGKDIAVKAPAADSNLNPEKAKAGNSIPAATPQDFAFTEIEMDKKPSDHDNLAVVPTSFGIPIQSRALPEVKIEEKEDESTPAPAKSKSKTQSLFRRWLWKNKAFVGIGFGAGLLTLAIMAIVFLMVAGKARLNLTLKQLNLNKDLTITLDPNLAESDFTKLALKSELISQDFAFNQTNETTGVTLVGEKAKGKVQIINKTDGVKTFAAGTTFSSGNLRFTLDDDVTVASTSVEVKQLTKVETFGTSEAHLTAVKIGADSNLPNDTKLVVADFSPSSYEALTVGAFTGGSSRELRVVSEADQAQLLLEVKKKILEIAAGQFKADSQADGQKTYISTGTITIKETNYSAKVGDEAKTLTLDAAATVPAISYQNQDLKPLAQHVLSDLVPDGYELIDKDPQILSAVDPNASGSSLVIDANISTQAVPKLDREALKKEIAGQSLSSATAILSGKGEIASFTIDLIPSIMKSLWKKIPGNINNLEIVVN